MGEYKKYGKWFAMAVAGSGFLLLVILMGFDSAWVVVPLVLVAIVLEVGAGSGESENAKRAEEEWRGRQFLDRAKNGRSRR